MQKSGSANAPHIRTRLDAHASAFTVYFFQAKAPHRHDTFHSFVYPSTLLLHSSVYPSYFIINFHIAFYHTHCSFLLSQTIPYPIFSSADHIISTQTTLCISVSFVPHSHDGSIPIISPHWKSFIGHSNFPSPLYTFTKQISSKLHINLLYFMSRLQMDLFCCNKPSLVKACISIPGISDHSIVLADCDLKATINKKPPRKVYQWSKADWQLIKEQTVIFANQFLALAQTRTVKENYTVFIEYMEGILAVNIPSKLSNSRHNLPWMNINLKRLIRKKGRRF